MRTPSVALSDYDVSSSPDPLASPANSVGSQTSTYKRAPSSAAARNSGMGRKSQEIRSILPPSSPSRTITEQTLSPWKIKVTVEAEPEDQEDGRLETITRTIKVPLRMQSPPAQKQGNTTKRSQPRNRTDAVSKGRHRSVTPTTERRRRQSVTDLDIVVLGDDADEDEWGKKQRKASPRKSRARKNTPKEHAENDKPSSAGFAVREDTDMEENAGFAAQDDSLELRQIDLNTVSVRTRSNSTKQKPQTGDHKSAQDCGVKALPAAVSAGRRTVSVNSVLTYPTPSPTASERGNSVEAEDSDQVNGHAEGFDTIIESEGFTMIDLDTIPSVRQILSSPAENQNGANTPASPVKTQTSVVQSELKATEKSIPAPFTRPIPPHLLLPEGESDISSTVPSSPPIFLENSEVTRHKSPLSYLQLPVQSRNRKVTPQTYSSPQLPSPPRQSVLKDRSTPDSAKALKATLALHGAINPVTRSTLLSQSQTIPISDQAQSNSEELFEGFDSGTKRELRAGLRFGEELAKRQQPNAFSHVSSTNIVSSEPAQIWRGESVISRTPVQQFDHMQQDNTNVLTFQDTASKLAIPGAKPSAIQHTADEQPRWEHQWQLEREAVSKQIQDASPSKVIVINSDDDDSEVSSQAQPQDQSIHDTTMGGDDDIWLEEAKNSSSSPRAESEDSGLFDSTEGNHQYERKRGEVREPARNCIPRSWKSGEQTEQGNNSTMITNGDDFSGIMWRQQPTDEVQFGTAAINNVRRELQGSKGLDLIARRTSGAFDIEKMLGTPGRIRKTLDEAPKDRPLLTPIDRASSSLMSDGNSKHSEEEAKDGDEGFDGSEDTLHSYLSRKSYEQTQQTVPVNFNESILSQSPNTPPTSRPTMSVSPSAVRPPTPRSAMKGSRRSIRNANGLALNGADQELRKVIFAERSKGVDIDWVESSSSVQLSTEDEASSPIVQHQKHVEERQVSNSATEHAQQENKQTRIQGQNNGQAPPQAQKGWLGWLWSNSNSQSVQAAEAAATLVQIDGTSDSSPEQNGAKSVTDREETRAVILSESRAAKLVLPSYLTSPSYPSDPTRSTVQALSTSGKFTNTHFRTLHILHRKSQRPRFHVPDFNDCRPELRKLVSERWKLEIDESKAGLGGFAWTVHEMEARVLERFCREVEFDRLKQSLSGAEVDSLASEWLAEDGIWGGNIEHGKGGVKWDWDVEQLATWLGRIVVGEVVREEEFGGSKHQTSN